MKPIMRQKLAGESFPEKIRKVSELIRLSHKFKDRRTEARPSAHISAVAGKGSEISTKT